MRALILDDEPAIGRVICRLAQRAGIRAEAARDAAQFQALYRGAPPDLVLLDLDLAGEDGAAQLRFLAAARYPHAVVLMSGYDRRVMAAAERLGRELGLEILGSIAKPFRADEVLSLFGRVAGRRLRPAG